MVHVLALVGLGIVDPALEMQEKEKDPIRALEYPLDSIPATVADPIVHKPVTGLQTLTAATVKLDPIRALEYHPILVFAAAPIVRKSVTGSQTLIVTIVGRPKTPWPSSFRRNRWSHEMGRSSLVIHVKSGTRFASNQQTF